MEYTPINLGINTTNPLDGYYQGLQDRAKLDLAKAQTNQANAQTDAFQQKTIADNLKAQAEAQQQANNLAMLQKITSPQATLDDYKAYALANPTSPNALKVWEQKDKDQKLAILQPASQIANALKAGNNQLALDTVNNSIEAFTNSGDTQNVGLLGVLKKTIQDHPDLALAGVLNSIMQVEGGDKIVGNILGKTQADIAQTEAQTNQVNATTAKTKADTVGQNISNSYAPQKTELDLQNTQSTINKNQADIANTESEIQKRANEINSPFANNPTTMKAVNSYVESGQQAQTTISKVDNILAGIPQLRQGGLWTKGVSTLKNSLGLGGEIEDIKRQISAFKNDYLIATKLDSTSTNEDTARQLKGTIDENSSPEQIEKYFIAAKKGLELKAELEQQKADWTSQVGSLGTANRPVEINGIIIPKGTNFKQYITHAPTNNIQSLIKKYAN